MNYSSTDTGIKLDVAPLPLDIPPLDVIIPPSKGTMQG